MTRFFILLFGIGLLATSCRSTKNMEADTLFYSTTWQSDPVRFVRGDIDETYRFFLDGDLERMDIVYHSTGSTEDERTVRQALDVSFDEERGKLVLTGESPQLVSGPEFVGVYGADVLYCNPSKDALECLWGSDAHGEAPVVILRPGR
ncbi:MAG: hypothetical protein KTR29_16090 [Rhodothermaceae bacterium]|nr:hypothetical protein [Rhodothermaceae bacterium]